MKKINTEKLAKAYALTRRLANPITRRILNMIIQEPDNTVTYYMVKLRMEQAMLSQHLGYLRQYGLVANTKIGKERHYYPTHKMSRVAGAIRHFGKEMEGEMMVKDEAWMEV